MKIPEEKGQKMMERVGGMGSDGWSLPATGPEITSLEPGTKNSGGRKQGNKGNRKRVL